MTRLSDYQLTPKWWINGDKNIPANFVARSKQIDMHTSYTASAVISTVKYVKNNLIAKRKFCSIEKMYITKSINVKFAWTFSLLKNT